MLIPCRRMGCWAFSISKFNLQKDYYKVLGVTAKADAEEIKKSFRTLAKQYHPDANQGHEDKFKEVNEAYQTLSDAAIKK